MYDFDGHLKILTVGGLGLQTIKRSEIEGRSEPVSPVAIKIFDNADHTYIPYYQLVCKHYKKPVCD